MSWELIFRNMKISSKQTPCMVYDGLCELYACIAKIQNDTFQLITTMLIDNQTTSKNTVVCVINTRFRAEEDMEEHAECKWQQVMTQSAAAA